MISEDNNETRKPGHRSLEKMSYAEKGRYFKIRNILNIIFILAAIIGMILFFYVSRPIGGGILIVAVFIKIAECVLRIMH